MKGFEAYHGLPAIIEAEAIEPQPIHGGVVWATTIEAINAISVPLHHRSP